MDGRFFARLLGAVLGLAVMTAPDVWAQTMPPEAVVKELAPTGTMRVAVLMVTYFAVDQQGELEGVVPDLGRELARRLGVPVQLVKYQNPAAVIAAFRDGTVDVTFIGITADRAAAFDFGPVVLDLQTTYLVPAASTITSIDEIDRPGVRIVAPARSAQDAYLRKTIRNATITNVIVENPKPAVDVLAAGEADAFSHVVPMLVSAQALLPGSRILPGSYYNVPIAIGYAKGRSGAAADYAKAFVADAKASGFAQQAIDRAGALAKGVVVNPQ